MTRLLGIDIGGSTSRARLVADGQVLAEAQADSASLTAAGPQAAEQALTSLLAQLPGTGPASLDAVCAGAAGLKDPRTRAFLLARLRPLTRTGLVCVVDDAALILPAAGLEEGICVICGTGSIAVGEWRQHRVRAGGWGYVLGDAGSGYWIARAAVRTLLARRDRGEPGGPLSSQLLTATGAADTDGLHAAFLRQPQPRYWAGHAPAVLDSADPAAASLAEAAAASLAGLCADVAARLTASAGAPAGLPVVLAGGLMAHNRLRLAVVAALARQLPDSAVRELAEPPVAGAIRLAAQLTGRQSG